MARLFHLSLPIFVVYVEMEETGRARKKEEAGHGFEGSGRWELLIERFESFSGQVSPPLLRSLASCFDLHPPELE